METAFGIKVSLWRTAEMGGSSRAPYRIPTGTVQRAASRAAAYATVRAWCRFHPSIRRIRECGPSQWQPPPNEAITVVRPHRSESCSVRKGFVICIVSALYQHQRIMHLD
ncbi:hypothetical protein RB195_006176 [Necator americanus]|uniref:Uncharacterized protein n=1 Tax=Necator americanus TaxID=51031 RepID=A0ABR1BU83_NECAM